MKTRKTSETRKTGKTSENPQTSDDGRQRTDEWRRSENLLFNCRLGSSSSVPTPENLHPPGVVQYPVEHLVIPADNIAA